MTPDTAAAARLRDLALLRRVHDRIERAMALLRPTSRTAYMTARSAIPPAT